MHFAPLVHVRYHESNRARTLHTGLVVSIELDAGDGQREQTKAESILWTLRNAVGRGFVLEADDGADLWIWNCPGFNAMEALAEIAEGLTERVAI